MSGWRTKTVLVLGLMMTIAAAAQENKPPTPTVPPPPVFSYPRVPPPPTASPGIITPIPSGNVPQRVLSLIPSPPNAGSSTRPEQSAERQFVPAKVELSDGTTLAGQLYLDAPLQGAALFGSIAIPLNQIRGIDWPAQTDTAKDAPTQPDQNDRDRKAKVVLINDDSLTMTLTMPTIQLKTSWGYAVVEFSKVRSMVLTAEKFKWEDTPLGRALVPDDEPKADNRPK